MSDLRLTIALGNYDRTAPLLRGKVPIEGVNPAFVTPRLPSEIFWRQISYDEFDVSEMSLSSFLILNEQKARDWVALPVFPSRAFRQAYLFVRSGESYTDPRPLKGKRIGLPEYELTITLWVRGFLEEDYSISPKDVTWVREREDKLDFPALHGDLKLELAPQGKGLDELLVEGQIDAFIHTRFPTRFKDKIRPVFKDSKPIEIDYFRRTGIFPMMHVVIIKGEIYRRHPWLARSLFKAFLAAKELCYQQQADHLQHSLPWHRSALEDCQEVMGEDWYAYGVEPNRRTLEAALRYAEHQGLVSKAPALDGLFLPVSWSNVAGEDRMLAPRS